MVPVRYFGQCDRRGGRGVFGEGFEGFFRGGEMNGGLADRGFGSGHGIGGRRADRSFCWGDVPVEVLRIDVLVWLARLAEVM